MQRPLMWVGVAYIAGGVWAALGQSLWSGVLSAALIMITIGRYRRQILKSLSFYILPVFFVSAFVNFSRAMAYPYDNILSKDSMEISFYGTVDSCEEKADFVAVTVKSAFVKTEKIIGDVDEQVREAEENRVGLIFYLDKGEEQLQMGDIIRGSGRLEKPERASNPGQFDAEGYYHAREIDYILWPDQIEVISKVSSYRLLLQQFRKNWINVYRQCMTEEDAGILSAILLGDKTLLDEETQELYRKVGIVHVLAISGLHISMIGMGIYKLLRRLGAGFRISACASSFLVLSYGVMTGFGPSTERAVIMFLVKMGAVYLGRSYDMLSAVSLAALIIFIRQPLMMTQAGVQFSFAAVLSIGVLWPAMRQILTGKGKLLNHIGPSVAVTIGTWPLTALYYGEIPLVSFFLNLLVLPIMEFMVPVGMISGMTGFGFIAAARFLVGSIHYLLAFNNWLCELASELPFAVWYTGVPPLILVVLYYGIIAVFIGMASKRRKQLLILLVACGLILMPFRKLNSMVAFLDVGQGDCIFIRSPSGTTWLVDGGSSDVKKAGQYRIIPFLNYYGENGVDYACVTHGDEDHLSGIRELLEKNLVRHLVLTKASVKDPACMELADMASENNIDTIYIEAGDYWQSGDWEFECIYPGPETDSEDKNDSSMVLKLQAGETAFLLTGDISEKTEAKLDGKKLENTDVLKVAHHGSGSSSSGEFLEKTGAEMAIISCGAGNRYGHPAQETIERLEDAGMDIWITMEKGAVLMLYRNGRFEVQAFLKD